MMKQPNFVPAGDAGRAQALFLRSEKIVELRCPRPQVAHERGNATGGQLTLTPEHRDACVLVPPLLEHLDRASRPQGGSREPERRACYSCAAQHRVPRGVAVVEGEPDAPRILFACKSGRRLYRPALYLAGATVAEADDVVATEFIRSLRRRPTLKIVRRGANPQGKLNQVCWI